MRKSGAAGKGVTVAKRRSRSAKKAAGASADPRALGEDRIAQLEEGIADERSYTERMIGAPALTLHKLSRLFKSVASAASEPGKRQPVAILLLSRDRAKEWRSAIDYALSLETSSRYLRGSVARALLQGGVRKSELKNRRQAMRQLESALLHIDRSSKRRQSRLNDYQVIRAYVAMTQGRGLKEFHHRSLEAMAERSESLTVECPVPPEIALGKIAQLYGFKTWTAALRRLIELRKKVRRAERTPGVSDEEIKAFLRDLPYVPGDDPSST